MSSSSSAKISFREKVGYSLGDAGANFVFQMMVVFQTAFYTDVVGLKAAAVGWMLLFVRISDAITDPIMGAIADRTQTRWGKFRPWLIWSAIPLALLFWVAYTVPEGLSGSARFWYSAITYTLYMMAYTMNNAPYYALNGVMTSNSLERTSISQYRFFAAMVAGFIVKGFTLPLVSKLGGGDDAKGWSLTVGIFAAIAVVFFIITFLSVKERVNPPKEQKQDFWKDVSNLRTNRPWVAMFVMAIFVFTTLAVRGSSEYYYFTYYVDGDALASLLADVGLFTSSTHEASPSLTFKALDTLGLIVRPESDPSKVGFSLFNMVGTFTTILCVMTAKPLARAFGKKAVFTVGLAGTALFEGMFFFLDSTSVEAMFILTILSGMCNGPTIPLLWAMIADTADYGEWKSERRATGFVFASIVFALKGGLGIGGALTGGLLAFYGYTPETATEPQMLLGFRIMVGLIPGALILFSVLCMLYYPITKRIELQMERELDARRLSQGEH